MRDTYIIYRCKICGKHFTLFTNEVKHSEKESRFITCPYHGKHKDIIVTGRFENIKEYMEDARTYKRKDRRVQQMK